LLDLRLSIVVFLQVLLVDLDNDTESLHDDAESLHDAAESLHDDAESLNNDAESLDNKAGSLDNASEEWVSLLTISRFKMKIITNFTFLASTSSKVFKKFAYK